MNTGASGSGSAMLRMAMPLMNGDASTICGPRCPDGSYYTPNEEWDRERKRLKQERENLIRAEKEYVASLECLMMPLV